MSKQHIRVKILFYLHANFKFIWSFLNIFFRTSLNPMAILHKPGTLWLQLAKQTWMYLMTYLFRRDFIYERVVWNFWMLKFGAALEKHGKILKLFSLLGVLNTGFFSLFWHESILHDKNISIYDFNQNK